MADCIIIGGGLIGLLTARALDASGMDVLVLERGTLGGESSWAGGGIISPLYPWRYVDAVNDLAARSKQIYPILYRELLDESGIDAEFHRCGMFITDDDDPVAAREWAMRYGERLLMPGTAGGTELPEVVRSICDGGGLWMPDVCQIRNPKLVQALRGGCEHRGITYRERVSVDEVLIEDGRACGVGIGEEVLRSEKVIVASGAWTGQFLSLKQDVAVSPVKGQMIMMKAQPGAIDSIIMSKGYYVIPRLDGHVLAGSTLEFSDFDKSVTEDAKQKLHESAIGLVPALEGLEVIRHWSGLRPGTRQGIPYICEHDQISGLYIHAGHHRNGIVLGAASAELMAQIVTGGQTTVDPEPYTMSAVH